MVFISWAKTTTTKRIRAIHSLNIIYWLIQTPILRFNNPANMWKFDLTDIGLLLLFGHRKDIHNVFSFLFQPEDNLP